MLHYHFIDVPSADVQLFISHSKRKEKKKKKKKRLFALPQ